MFLRNERPGILLTTSEQSDFDSLTFMLSMLCDVKLDIAYASSFNQAFQLLHTNPERFAWCISDMMLTTEREDLDLSVKPSYFGKSAYGVEMAAEALKTGVPRAVILSSDPRMYDIGWKILHNLVGGSQSIEPKSFYDDFKDIADKIQAPTLFQHRQSNLVMGGVRSDLPTLPQSNRVLTSTQWANIMFYLMYIALVEQRERFG